MLAYSLTELIKRDLLMGLMPLLLSCVTALTLFSEAAFPLSRSQAPQKGENIDLKVTPTGEITPEKVVPPGDKNANGNGILPHGGVAKRVVSSPLLNNTRLPPGPMKSSASRSATPPPVRKALTVRVPRFEERPIINGRLDEKVWQRAAVLDGFYQIHPGDNILPSKPTEVLLGYDTNNFYIAFRAHDDLGKVRATVAQRDAIFNDDNVSVFLDTFNDKRRAYRLSFNPLGVQADAIFTEGEGEDYSVDILMESKGELSADGYMVEVAIPFDSLRFAAGEDKCWGVHFFRVIKRSEGEQSSWMPISRDESRLLYQSGYITGLEGISTERVLEVIPTLTLSETGHRVRSPSQFTLNYPQSSDLERFVNRPIKIDPGLTLKFGITPSVILDLTLNPDFAEVEADQPVITANQRFPIFFREKRPFFLEGIDVFQTPLQAVHTRAIVDPDAAIKLIGKHGRNTFGILLASDNAPGNLNSEERLNPRDFRLLDKNASIGVLRLKRDVGEESSIGLVATSYNFVERSNHLGGFDGRFRLSPQMVLSFQVLGTTSRRFFYDPKLDQSVYRTGNSLGYNWNLNKSGRHLSYNLGGQGRTRDYVADVGFTRRTNTNSKTFFIGYYSEPRPKAKLISWSLSNSAGANFDWQGRMQSWDNIADAGFYLRGQTSFSLGLVNGYERLFEEEFGPVRTPTRTGTFFGSSAERSTYRKGVYVSASTTPSKKFSADLFVGHTLNKFEFDYGAGPRFGRVSPAALKDPNAPLDPGPGKAWDINANFTLQPTDALRLSLSYTKSKLTRNDTGRVAFDDNIYILHASYYFTRFTFVRARIDHDTLASQSRGQFLLGWTPSPGTSLYVVYNDDFSSRFNPFTGQLEPGFRRNRRTFFIKISYLFRRSLRTSASANATRKL